MSEGCIFCKIAQGDKEDFIYENENFFSIFDINPILEGHTLVISKKHFETVLDMPENLNSDLIDAIKNTSNILKEKYNAEGFNVLSNIEKCAGQIIPHLHFHVIPRKSSDNKIMIFADKK